MQFLPGMLRFSTFLCDNGLGRDSDVRRRSARRAALRELGAHILHD